MAIEVGSVVKLKSGGPKMTVVSKGIQKGHAESREDTVICSWFCEEAGQCPVQSTSFPMDCLVEVTPAE